jgi:SAM-dependent methyltransferase
VSEQEFAAAFANVAGAYELGRPGYPAAALDAVSEALTLGRDAIVVDLAAGTGKLTRDLVPRFGRVLAVEPLAELRAELARAASAVDVREGTAEDIPLDAASADAVFVAQAFHWFAGRPALDEIARVLRPRGGLALLWNTTPWELREGSWFAGLDDVLERCRVDLSVKRRHASGLWRDAFAGEQRFAELAIETFDNDQEVSREEFLAGLGSRSYLARLDAGARGVVLDEVAGLFARDDAPVRGDRVLVPMRTDVVWTRLVAIVEAGA